MAANSYLDAVGLALGLPRDPGDMTALVTAALGGGKASDFDEETFANQVADHLLAVVADRPAN